MDGLPSFPHTALTSLICDPGEIHFGALHRITTAISCQNVFLGTTPKLREKHTFQELQPDVETPRVLRRPRALLALARLWPEGKSHSISKFWIKFCLNSVSKGASRSSPEGPHHHHHNDQCPVAVLIQNHKVHYYPCSMLKPATFTSLVSLRSCFREMPVLIRTASLHRHSFTVSVSQVKNLKL